MGKKKKSMINNNKKTPVTKLLTKRNIILVSVILVFIAAGLITYFSLSNNSVETSRYIYTLSKPNKKHDDLINSSFIEAKELINNYLLALEGIDSQLLTKQAKEWDRTELYIYDSGIRKEDNSELIVSYAFADYVFDGDIRIKNYVMINKATLEDKVEVELLYALVHELIHILAYKPAIHLGGYTVVIRDDFHCYSLEEGMVEYLTNIIFNDAHPDNIQEPYYWIFVRIIEDLHSIYGNEMINSFLRGDPYFIINDFDNFKPEYIQNQIVNLTVVLKNLSDGKFELYQSNALKVLEDWEKIYPEFKEFMK